MTFNNIILGINAFIALVTTGLAVMTYFNRKAIQEVHLSINSRMDQLLTAARGVATAEGREIGRSEKI